MTATKSLAIALALTGSLGFFTPANAEDKADDGFVSLFDGTSLNGWHGDKDMWKVTDGAIVGRTDGDIPHNTFLISDKKYDNFVLKVKFKLYDHKGNSGVQYRSKESDGFVAAGYQADIADNHYMGILYSEKTGRGILVEVNDEAKQALAKAVKQNDWNEYVITAKGKHLTQTLNGVMTVDFVDEDERALTSGIIALQLHRGHDMKIAFKDIAIKELK